MKDPRIISTAAEIREAGKRARVAAKNLTVIVDARYAKPQDAIIVRLNTGSTFSVPRARLPGLQDSRKLSYPSLFGLSLPNRHISIHLPSTVIALANFVP